MPPRLMIAIFSWVYRDELENRLRNHFHPLIAIPPPPSAPTGPTDQQEKDNISPTSSSRGSSRVSAEEAGELRKELDKVKGRQEMMMATLASINSSINDQQFCQERQRQDRRVRLHRGSPSVCPSSQSNRCRLRGPASRRHLRRRSRQPSMDPRRRRR